MDLTEEQKQKISEWISEGLNLSRIQQRLNEEFQLSLTYLDLRFLIDDLNLEIPDTQPKPSPHDALDSNAAAPRKEPKTDDAGFADLEPAGQDGVTVEVDRVTKPGAVVSGQVTFSDGKSSAWALDQSGRLMLEGAEEGYKPSQEDLQAFQQELSRQLQKQGF